MGYYSGTLQKGSNGEETKKWQEYLRSQGYNLDVDGIFGDITDQYTRKYQEANGLTVDGIVGKNTWGKAGFSDLHTPVSAPTIKPMPTAPTYDTTSWDDTDKGKGALGAYNTAKDAVANYGDFAYGNQQQLNGIIDRILNREKFSYDLNGDALYQQYKDKYIQQGKMAMGDAIGQASAMTGGYGNSYAQSVGQQMYQKELQNLNDIVPELYQMALDKYNMDGQELYNQYGMLSDDYSREYGEWNDKYGRLMDSLGIAKGDYYDGANMHYTEQGNKNTVAGKEFDDAMSIWQNETDNAWKNADWEESARRNQLDEIWKEKEFDAVYGKKNDVDDTNNPTDPTDPTPPKVEEEPFKAVNSEAVSTFKAAIRTRNEFYRGNNPDKQKYGNYNAYIEGVLDKWLQSGKLNEDEVATLIAYYGLS